MMRARLLLADDEAWSSFLVRSEHDFYHSSGYLSLCARQEGGEARALLVEDGARAMLLPLIVRSISDGRSDATSPYGYPGPLLTGAGGSEFLRVAMLEGIRLLGANGIVSLFVRMHPLLNRLLPDGVGTLVSHGDTVAVDLTLPASVLWGQTRSNHRLQINRALRNGFTTGDDEQGVHSRDFRRLYRDTMVRASASAYYFFDDAYFDGLKGVLGSSMHLLTVDLDGTLASAGLFVETRGIVQYHLSGTEERFLAHQPTKLLLHHARTWAKSRGNHWLHLGGGLGAANDSLLHFKTGFSPLRQPFYTLRVIVQHEEYRRLVHENSPGANPDDLSGYFPLYRRSYPPITPGGPVLSDPSDEAP